MGPNPQNAEPIEPVLYVPVSMRMESDLEALVKTGLFGLNGPDAARRLLEEGLIGKQWLIRHKKQAE